LNNQIDELEKKQKEIEKDKADKRKQLKLQYEQSLKDQVEKKKREKD
jgi:hypothetical protein